VTVRMNFGAGSVQPEGWVNVDKEPLDRSAPFWASDGEGGGMWQLLDPDGEDDLDVTRPGPYENDVRDGLGWPDETFDYIVANHSLSDLTFHELPGALSELYRVIRPGGVLRVLVPHFEEAIRAWERHDRRWFPQGDDLETVDERFCTFVTWFGTVGSVFTPHYLYDLLHETGFEKVCAVESGYTVYGVRGIYDLDGDRTTALIMEGRK
jgi:predicted SAM-dependent methyltransferase